jgi:Ergosterol biosynthesis ERG4/ERG24 family
VAAGLYVFLLTFAAAVVLGFYTQTLDLAWVYDNFVPLLSASTAFSFLFSVCLYAASFRRKALLAKGGTSGWHVYDFFMGRELNPRSACSRHTVNPAFAPTWSSAPIQAPGTGGGTCF